MKVEIKKPLYGNFVYINNRIIDQAIRQGEKLEITVPNGTGLADPNEWKKTGKILKKVFRFPDNPMILYGNHVPIKKEESNQAKLL